jgi:hypothetical protein
MYLKNIYVCYVVCYEKTYGDSTDSLQLIVSETYRA